MSSPNFKHHLEHRIFEHITGNLIEFHSFFLYPRQSHVFEFPWQLSPWPQHCKWSFQLLLASYVILTAHQTIQVRGSSQQPSEKKDIVCQPKAAGSLLGTRRRHPQETLARCNRANLGGMITSRVGAGVQGYNGLEKQHLLFFNTSCM